MIIPSAGGAALDPVRTLQTGVSIPFEPSGIQAVRTGQLVRTIKYGPRHVPGFTSPFKKRGRHKRGARPAPVPKVVAVAPGTTPAAAKAALSAATQFAGAAQTLAYHMAMGHDADMLLGDERFVGMPGMPCPGIGSLPGLVCRAGKIMAQGRPVFAKFAGLTVKIESPVAYPGAGEYTTSFNLGGAGPFDGGELGAVRRALSRRVSRLPARERRRLSAKVGRGSGRHRRGRLAPAAPRTAATTCPAGFTLSPAGTCVPSAATPTTPTLTPCPPGFTMAPDGMNCLPIPGGVPGVTPFPGALLPGGGPAPGAIIPGGPGVVTVGPPTGGRAGAAATPGGFPPATVAPLAPGLCPPGYTGGLFGTPCRVLVDSITRQPIQAAQDWWKTQPGAQQPGASPYGAMPGSSPYAGLPGAMPPPPPGFGCPPGMQLSPDGRACVPTSALPPGTPPGQPLPPGADTSGGLAPGCPPGMQLGPDGRSCAPVAAAPPPPSGGGGGGGPMAPPPEAAPQRPMYDEDEDEEEEDEDIDGSSLFYQ